MKPKSAQWQKAYRERALQAGMYKLQTWLDPATARQLEQICQRDGLTKREAVQQAIQQLYEQNRDQASAEAHASVRPVKVYG
ncbi:M2 family metallopeptidase [Acidithiobacillus thiooxidans]|uniref:hypothetical protein n=1 Tax=Acidithiobacillus thiooxidans TaxID=930 RepID=UPI001C06F9AE|nr:hypothetical protein [Acidithiobacillus thiooxidans]MBU2837672.1 M2 family metallopeptidase [Acidithiobacillus thiooxidans]